MGSASHRQSPRDLDHLRLFLLSSGRVTLRPPFLTGKENKILSVVVSVFFPVGDGIKFSLISFSGSCGYSSMSGVVRVNKTGTSKVGAISKAQKAQFSKYAQDVFMKSFENTFETHKVCLSCSIWLENHFSRLETKNFLKIFLKIFFWKKLRKRRIVPKNEKRGPFGIH